MIQYVADFETTTDPSDVRVWAWAICEIATTNIVARGTEIEDFINFLKPRKSLVYFHNLKFDGHFVLYWLLTNGFEEVENELKKDAFKTLISDMGAYYSIKVKWNESKKNSNYTEFRDSYKKLPYSVDTIGRDFIGGKTLKLKLDYAKHRPRGYQPNEKEWLYIDHDVLIVAQGLQIMFDQELSKMTIGSDALAKFKDTCGNKFKAFFPELKKPVYEFLKYAYKGGWVYCNPKFKNKMVRGVVYDVNSMYPWALRHCPMPYDKPIWFDGEYVFDDAYPLYIIRLSCQFDLKKDHLPTVQLRNNAAFIETEYLTTSRNSAGIDVPVTLTLTNVDLDLMKEHYNLENIQYIGGYKFRASTTLFKQYVDECMHNKIYAPNDAIRTLWKLLANNIYGKFGQNDDDATKHPYIDDQGVMRFETKHGKPQKTLYIPVAAFTTAWARDNLIRSAQKNYNRFIYADTDSVHLYGFQKPFTLWVDDKALGAWKEEYKFKCGKYLRAKTYIDIMAETTKKHKENEMVVKCAGMPDEVKKKVTFNNFKYGKDFTGKLMPKSYPGGIVLVDSTFTIKPEKLAKAKRKDTVDEV